MFWIACLPAESNVAWKIMQTSLFPLCRPCVGCRQNLRITEHIHSSPCMQNVQWNWWSSCHQVLFRGHGCLKWIVNASFAADFSITKILLSLHLAVLTSYRLLSPRTQFHCHWTSDKTRALTAWTIGILKGKHEALSLGGCCCRLQQMSAG